MGARRPQLRPILLIVSLLVVPLALAGCGGSTTTASGGGGGAAGPTPTSAVAAAIARVSNAYGNMAAALPPGPMPAWMTVGADGKSVAITITTSGVTLNGTSNGKMTITIPQGWKVSIADTNATSTAQSLVIAALANTPLPATGFIPAFTGASTAKPSDGQARDTQRFTFTATAAGHYLMLSDVSGQAAAGLWANVVVSTTARAPGVTIA
jgi:uncharacterized cupredoxin-like copper-binding protein